jgi:thiol-disulfide isomerase/thioredoxin
MRLISLLIALGLIALIGGLCFASDPPPPTTRNTIQIPKEVIRTIDAQFVLPEHARTQEEAIKIFTKRMETVIQLGLSAEGNYPSAPNLHEVRRRMLRAAEFLAGQKKDDTSRERLIKIANRVLASDAPRGAKVRADFHLTQQKIAPMIKTRRHRELEQEVLAYVKRYEGTPTAVRALILGTALAMQDPHGKLHERFIETMKHDYPDNPEVREFLIRAGRSEGLPFSAVLTRLDGKKLSLPDDLRGKVVVVDFWATWCPPCVASIPHMKQLYAKHKSHGLEIVGISLDNSRPALEKMIKERGMNWVHTFSRLGWNDPTAQRYGIRAIPMIWVVGRDGKILSDGATNPNASTLKEALAPLDRIVEEALKQPAPVVKK